MKKDDFWVISLVALFIIAIAIHWVFWIRLAVILNALLVLFNTGKKIYNNYKKGKNANGPKR